MKPIENNFANRYARKRKNKFGQLLAEQISYKFIDARPAYRKTNKTSPKYLPKMAKKFREIESEIPHWIAEEFGDKNHIGHRQWFSTFGRE